MKHEELTEKIIGAAYAVYNKLGFGFLESVYQNAMKIELEKAGIKFEAEKPIKVHYDGKIVGDFAADIVVDDKVIIELKALRSLNEAHEVQLVNYLKATGIEVGLLINFGERIQVKRKIFDKR
jgi:GxxExxY protein